jgi:hypothetical protein
VYSPQKILLRVSKFKLSSRYEERNTGIGVHSTGLHSAWERF